MSTSTGWRRIVDVAARYRADLTPLQNGHYTVYHDDLAEAARGLGYEVVTLGGVDGIASEGVRPCLPDRDTVAQAREIARYVQAGDLVMVYEGSVALLDALVPVAAAAPRATFVVNLFRTELGIDDSGTVDPQRPEQLRTLGRALPENLRVAAETPERAVLARRAGLPVRGVWSLHSVLATVAPPPSTAESRPLRVLVPLRPGGFDAGPVGDVAYVAHQLALRTDGAVRVSVPYAPSASLKARVRSEHLARLGVHLLAPSNLRTEYAAMFASHDVVWIVSNYDFSNGYVTQSSGKTLDALVAGVPVLGAPGSTTAREPLRWTGRPLGVGSRDEAVAALCELADTASELKTRLRSQQEAIRSAYAPETTIRRVLEIAAREDDAWADPLLDRAADLSPSAGQWTTQDAAESIDPPLRERIHAGLVARWAVRLPWSRRLWGMVRQRLRRLKAAVLTRRRPAPPSSL